jgi:hypothetical protein
MRDIPYRVEAESNNDYATCSRCLVCIIPGDAHTLCEAGHDLDRRPPLHQWHRSCLPEPRERELVMAQMPPYGWRRVIAPHYDSEFTASS